LCFVQYRDRKLSVSCIRFHFLPSSYTLILIDLKSFAVLAWLPIKIIRFDYLLLWDVFVLSFFFTEVTAYKYGSSSLLAVGITNGLAKCAIFIIIREHILFLPFYFLIHHGYDSICFLKEFCFLHLIVLSQYL
jgi:hypothetical protein